MKILKFDITTLSRESACLGGNRETREFASLCVCRHRLRLKKLENHANFSKKKIRIELLPRMPLYTSCICTFNCIAILPSTYVAPNFGTRIASGKPTTDEFYENLVRQKRDFSIITLQVFSICSSAHVYLSSRPVPPSTPFFRSTLNKRFRRILSLYWKTLFG